MKHIPWTNEELLSLCRKAKQYRDLHSGMDLVGNPAFHHWLHWEHTTLGYNRTRYAVKQRIEKALSVGRWLSKGSDVAPMCMERLFSAALISGLLSDEEYKLLRKGYISNTEVVIA